MPTNAAVAIGLLIDLTTQALKLQQTLQTAAAEGRDVTADELKTAQGSAQMAIDALRAKINSLG